MEGHFGNEVLHLTFHLTGEEAWYSFRAMSERITNDDLRNLLQELASSIDEHSALYLRFGKQDLLLGRLVFSASDPIRVRVKPRQYMVRGNTNRFYKQILERSS